MTLLEVGSRVCRTAGHKIWLHSRITILSAASVPVIFSSPVDLDENNSRSKTDIKIL